MAATDEAPSVKEFGHQIHHAGEARHRTENARAELNGLPKGHSRLHYSSGIIFAYASLIPSGLDVAFTWLTGYCDVNSDGAAR